MILVFNAGSSTLKFGCFDARSLTARVTGLIDWSSRDGGIVVRDGSGVELLRKAESAGDYRSAVGEVLEVLAAAGIAPASGAGHGISAVGHRVVHGGSMYRAGVAVDAKAKEAIIGMSALAPKHNPLAFEVIEAAEAALGVVPQVAVFDTAYFADLPTRAHVYPLPYAWYAEWGIRRFGFHGISHEYCAGRVIELDAAGAPSAIVICHLGSGCSAAAVRDGRPIATTMGFTPLEGLMMGTRAGSFDPGILLYLMREKGIRPDELAHEILNESGLRGVSGISGDFREVEHAASRGDHRARLALDLYADRVRSAIGSLAVTLGSVDALVFTGGVGENSATLRAAACEGLQCLGIHIDPDKNRQAAGDREIGASHSHAKIWAIRTREDLMIAREARRVAGRVELSVSGAPN